jgi:outer membrane murein-binding lipoprotein Lpp
MRSEAIKQVQAKLEQAQAEFEQALSDAKSAKSALYKTEHEYKEMAGKFRDEMITITYHCTKATGTKDRAEKKGLWMTKAPTDKWAYNMEQLLIAKLKAIDTEVGLTYLAVNVSRADYEKAATEKSKLQAEVDIIEKHRPGTLKECRKLEQTVGKQAK